LWYLLDIETEDRQQNLCYKSPQNGFSEKSGDTTR